MLKDNVLKTIKKYNLIEPEDKIVVGVSGGPDSMSLINILNELKSDLKIELFVAHINHNIRKEAKEDEEFVVKYCKKKNIEVYTLDAKIKEISKNEKKGLEETGRKIRYDFFEEILNLTNANKIATAHTANDNAETVLMNIIRGTGISGLKGIRPIRDKKFIRPLIETSRQEIEEYCKNEKLNPRIDKTNFENDYTRNKVRNILIPLIQQEFNSNIIESLNRLSNISYEENEYLEEITSDIFKKIKLEENEKHIVLDLKLFNKQNTVIKKRIILYTINILLGNVQGIGKIHIDDIIKLCRNNLGNKYLTPNKNIKILIKNKKIFFIKIENFMT